MYSDVFCKVYNEFGWNYYPEIFGEQLLRWLEVKNLRPRTAMDLACGTGILCNILHQQGIEASGMDFSAGMIDIAKAGNPWAQFLYAQCLIEGKGVREDPKQALRWYEKAAANGLTEGRVMAAIARYGALGTKKNKLLAKLWLTCAIKDEQFKKKYGKQEKIISVLAEIEHKTRFADCW